MYIVLYIRVDILSSAGAARAACVRLTLVMVIRPLRSALHVARAEVSPCPSPAPLSFAVSLHVVASGHS